FRFAVMSRSRPETYRTWPTRLSLFFGALTLPTEMAAGPFVHTIEQGLVAGFGAGLSMLVAIIITAFFIPNMLRKGSVDLLLAKPIARWKLLAYKFVGGLAFMFITTVVIVVGVWVALGVRHRRHRPRRPAPLQGPRPAQLPAAGPRPARPRQPGPQGRRQARLLHPLGREPGLHLRLHRPDARPGQLALRHPRLLTSEG